MVEDLDELAAKFFKTFSRMEYALKAASFHNGNGKAEANWTKFSEAINTCFDDIDDPDLIAALDYIESNPPKKQIVRDGALEWSEVAPRSASKVDLVLLYIRRVRNNLFHGGKFNGHWFEPERSQELLSHSLVVLNACLDANQNVKAAYEG
ncbi:hypothetical protein [Terasakiella sp.]|uniref:hypothetical protein n=1 Tax=Terasakiella sp. TaxID=2034861 RepID=UPI003AA89D13